MYWVKRMILSHRKWCYKTNSWYLPDLSFSFGGCLIVLFDSLLVAVNVLETEGETEKEREVKIIQGYLTATVKVPLLFMFPLLKKICSTTCCVLRCDIFFPGFNFSQFSRYITSNQKKKRKKNGGLYESLRIQSHELQLDKLHYLHNIPKVPNIFSY